MREGYAMRISPFVASFVGIVRVNVPAVIDCAEKVKTPQASTPVEAVL